MKLRLHGTVPDDIGAVLGDIDPSSQLSGLGQRSFIGEELQLKLNSELWFNFSKKATSIRSHFQETLDVVAIVLWGKCTKMFPKHRFLYYRYNHSKQLTKTQA